MNDNHETAPKWRSRPAIIDANLSTDLPWAKVRSAGYSNKFEVAAPIQLTSILYSQRPEYLYVTGTLTDCIHAFWFADCGGTAEFDLIGGQLTHLDCHGCDISISGTTLIFGPHRPGGNRLSIGTRQDVPRNSEELFFATLGGYRPEGWEGHGK